MNAHSESRRYSAVIAASVCVLSASLLLPIARDHSRTVEPSAANPPTPKYQVKGKVVFKNTPVAGARVTFQSEGGPTATGVTNQNGEFILKALEDGNSEASHDGLNKVTIELEGSESEQDSSQR